MKTETTLPIRELSTNLSDIYNGQRPCPNIQRGYEQSPRMVTKIRDFSGYMADRLTREHEEGDEITPSGLENFMGLCLVDLQRGYEKRPQKRDIPEEFNHLTQLPEQEYGYIAMTQGEITRDACPQEFVEAYLAFRRQVHMERLGIRKKE